jgi:pSer/pThr/pTyr-binding forkhead associated (FHA) protein
MSSSSMLAPSGAVVNQNKPFAYLLVPAGTTTLRMQLFEHTRYTIGRTSACDICFQHDGKVSKLHATIKGGKIKDKRSQNGTYVNGVLIKKHLLSDGDTIMVGDTQIVWHLIEAEKPINPMSTVSARGIVSNQTPVRGNHALAVAAQAEAHPTPNRESRRVDSADMRSFEMFLNVAREQKEKAKKKEKIDIMALFEEDEEDELSTSCLQQDSIGSAASSSLASSVSAVVQVSDNGTMVTRSSRPASRMHSRTTSQASAAESQDSWGPRSVSSHSATWNVGSAVSSAASSAASSANVSLHYPAPNDPLDDDMFGDNTHEATSMPVPEHGNAGATLVERSHNLSFLDKLNSDGGSVDNQASVDPKTQAASASSSRNSTASSSKMLYTIASTNSWTRANLRNLSMSAAELRRSFRCTRIGRSNTDEKNDSSTAEDIATSCSQGQRETQARVAAAVKEASKKKRKVQRVIDTETEQAEIGSSSTAMSPSSHTKWGSHRSSSSELSVVAGGDVSSGGGASSLSQTPSAENAIMTSPSPSPSEATVSSMRTSRAPSFLSASASNSNAVNTSSPGSDECARKRKRSESISSSGSNEQLKLSLTSSHRRDRRSSTSLRISSKENDDKRKELIQLEKALSAARKKAHKKRDRLLTLRARLLSAGVCLDQFVFKDPLVVDLQPHLEAQLGRMGFV